MFKKILIANRGEIACRIIRTAKRMNIGTVAVYSDADRDGLHVRLADEAVYIGPSEAAKSYLSIGRILVACKTTGAEAVHPGYGFLSEQVAFAEALRENGIVFIGPRPEAIAAMGDKIVSKKKAALAGVSTIPGHPDALETADQAVAVAQSIGYPVMIKASAGGGGKGMRIARNDTEAREGYERARSEALSAFGDDRVFVEKYISEPRHIEIQVLGDKHGNLVHLGERECSVQRRNQKVLEEAPSPLLDERMRKLMGEQAVALARAVEYDSAGTVEFVVGQDRSFYFLEMNTRIQVEHPVTELVTGLDLVEQMIRVAAGEPLQMRQDNVGLSGWAVEARVYAEDPAEAFVPSSGRLTLFRPPETIRSDAFTVRVDCGVEEGSVISVYYDPMIAKLIVHASTRMAAIAALAASLDSFAIEGVKNNRAFLSRLMTLPRWLEGRLSTSLIAEEFGTSVNVNVQLGPQLKRLAVVCAAAHCRLEQSRYFKTVDSGPLAVQEFTLTPGKDAHPRLEPMHFTARPQGSTISVKLAEGDEVEVATDWMSPEPTFRAAINGEPIVCQVRLSASKIAVEHAGARLEARILERHAAALMASMPARDQAQGGGVVLAPMPGLVRAILVSVGEDVHIGQAVAVVEAMKAEVTISARVSGQVTKIIVAPGGMVDANSPLLSVGG